MQDKLITENAIHLTITILVCIAFVAFVIYGSANGCAL